MTPDDIAILEGKLDTMHVVLSDLRVSVVELATEFRGHRKLEEQAAKTRAETCPKAPVVDKAINDLDALAGIVRDGQHRIRSLEQWRSEIDTDGLVDLAEKRIIFAPLKWAAKNGEKILLAVILAYIIFKLGIG